MTPQNIATLVNLLGFITGAALYGMLLAMVLRASSSVQSHLPNSILAPRSASSTERLLLATALLGLLWNLGALVTNVMRDWGGGGSLPWLEALVFTALGFLPAVVVHSVLRAGVGTNCLIGVRFITATAYSFSVAAGLLHFYSAAVTGETPSAPALVILTLGFGGLAIALLIYTRRSPVGKRALWVVALAVFAVSALHLIHHTGSNETWEPWFIELIGHHASLPLVIAMLYQDYRFALADIFLKRALALVVLVTLAFSLYLAAAPFWRMREARGDLDPRAVGVLLAFWIGTALIYPVLRRGVIWFVDIVVLRRANYQELRDALARTAAVTEDPEAILDQVSRQLARALTAQEIYWLRNETPSDVTSLSARQSGKLRRVTATVLIPTHEAPRYTLVIGELSGGRQLLSDDHALLESVALMLARRIDAVRVAHERCERNLREQEISALATEAELRALRAQLNPHFLFNALTTISYLIQTSPERALETLMKLTGLLRTVLRAPTGDLATLGEEMELVESYLAIERARFEERLRVVIDAPLELRELQLPPLVIQPLVENAIKHGIAPCRNGGEISVVAWIENGAAIDSHASRRLCLAVRDTGAGVSESVLAQGRTYGVGLANVERRLKCFYGEAASLRFKSQLGEGAAVEVRVPLRKEEGPRITRIGDG